MSDAGSASLAAALRGSLVDYLRDQRAVRTARVEAALRAVPRHVFLPGTALATAYADEVVVTRRDGDGRAVSSASQPAIVAAQLEQTGVGLGQRILEIGAATGYNAALLAWLAGPDGHVSTVEIDPELAAGAAEVLRSAGFPEVRVRCGDGASGDPSGAPFDRILVTVGAWDLPPAWLGQLGPDGRLVVPLRVRGLTYSIAFVREGGHLRSTSIEACGFVPMRGSDAYTERFVGFHGTDAGLIVDDGQDTDGVAGALGGPRAEVWTGLTVGPYEPLSELELRLAGLGEGFGRLVGGPASIAGELVKPALLSGSSAIFARDSVAYVGLRRVGETDRHELGVYAHGPCGDKLLGRVADTMQEWETRGREQWPVIRVYRAGTPDGAMAPGLVVDKRHTRVVLSWAG